MTVRRAHLATFRPFRMAAAARRSVMRALVQEPIKTKSAFVPATAPTGTTFPGEEGLATVGSISSTRTRSIRQYSASGSESQAMIPFLAPASIAMLQMVSRCSTGRLRIASPANSRAL